MRTLALQFPGTRQHYHYLYTGQKDVKAGDHAVVHSNGAFAVLPVKGVTFGIGEKVTKPVLAVLTESEWNSYQEQIKAINEHRAAFDELDYHMKESKRLEKYKDFATESEDPRVRALYAKIIGFQNPALEARPFEMPPVAPPPEPAPFKMDLDQEAPLKDQPTLKVDEPVTQEDLTRATVRYKSSERLTRADIETARPGFPVGDVPSALEPIPPGISVRRTDTEGTPVVLFYNKEGMEQGTTFWSKWKDRWAEFPTYVLPYPPTALEPAPDGSTDGSFEAHDDPL